MLLRLERFSKDLEEVNERCIKVQQIPTLLKRHSINDSLYTQELRSLCNFNDNTDANFTITESLRARLQALVAVRSKKMDVFEKIQGT